VNEGQLQLLQKLGNLKGSEDLSKCTTEFRDVFSDLKVEEGSLKGLNDEFGPNVERLKTTLKSAFQVEI